MSEMVEAVAAAILHELNSGGTPGRDPDRMNRVARAAIEAMREMTAAQCVAMYLAWDTFQDGEEEGVMGPREALIIYQAAIDAALRQD